MTETAEIQEPSTIRHYFNEFKLRVEDVLNRSHRRLIRMLGGVPADRSSNLYAHAREELARVAAQSEDNDPINDLMDRNILDLVAVFSAQHHSGFSAPFAIRRFKTLASFEILQPLQGTDDEWNFEYADDDGDAIYQNRRLSHVFKDNKGNVWDIEGYIFYEYTDDGDPIYYTCKESQKPVTFPYYPQREYIYRPTEDDD